MTLHHSPEASLTYNPTSETLSLSYNATRLSVSFGQAYQQALEEMLAQNVGKLLLDLKHHAPPTEDETEQIIQPLLNTVPERRTQPFFIAAVVSEGQYQYQIGSYSASAVLPSAPVEFNYFTSRREATEWLSEN